MKDLIENLAEAADPVEQIKKLVKKHHGTLKRGERFDGENYRYKACWDSDDDKDAFMDDAFDLLDGDSPSDMDDGVICNWFNVRGA